jgi:hypothetical protein
MKTVERIIETLHNGGKWQHIRIENDPYMPLVIEHVGRSPQGNNMISVAHYFEQNGDLCQDPEMVFEVGPAGWLPVFFQQAIPPIYREAIVFKGGEVLIDRRQMADQKSFARVWDRNLKHQGFLKQAQLMAGKKETTFYL